MISPKRTPYHVDFSVPATSQWHSVLAQADSIHLGNEVREAMRRVIANLKKKPVRFGNALYRTKLPGGSVRLGIQSPLAIRFVLFKNERKVLVIAVHAVPASPLDR